ncbi:hypothetical protein I7I50_04453 [Histoplasma capsulatum G186AR]|uniref:Uncharacterized protein n=1 Tax=Ajellomyces capsulatus TaxID=5037 RepID=A0A8H7YK69_AJECA|nr:hypothetical protein I7I52_05361 [Histoplasma capsulatum]QSS75342.1 hypothetical protein I7I50_04453 [Histoplasma capsulatum G186AR]
MEKDPLVRETDENKMLKEETNVLCTRSDNKYSMYIYQKTANKAKTKRNKHFEIVKKTNVNSVQIKQIFYRLMVPTILFTVLLILDCLPGLFIVYLLCVTDTSAFAFEVKLREDKDVVSFASSSFL